MSNNLVTIEVATEILGNTKASIYVSACVYKKKHGEYPIWFISNGKRGASRSYIDIDVLLQRKQDELDAYEYGTNNLWWKLEYLYNANQLAYEMASRSTTYPLFQSWRAFFTRHLFTEPAMIKLNDNVTMRQEFVIIGKELIREHIVTVSKWMDEFQ